MGALSPRMRVARKVIAPDGTGSVSQTVEGGGGYGRKHSIGLLSERAIEARALAANFMRWNNLEHRPSAIGYVTLQQRHRPSWPLSLRRIPRLCSATSSLVMPHARLVAHRCGHSQSKTRNGGQPACLRFAYSTERCLGELATNLTRAAAFYSYRLGGSTWALSASWRKFFWGLGGGGFYFRPPVRVVGIAIGFSHCNGMVSRQMMRVGGKLSDAAHTATRYWGVGCNCQNCQRAALSSLGSASTNSMPSLLSSAKPKLSSGICRPMPRAFI